MAKVVVKPAIASTPTLMIAQGATVFTVRGVNFGFQGVNTTTLSINTVNVPTFTRDSDTALVVTRAQVVGLPTTVGTTISAAVTVDIVTAGPTAIGKLVTSSFLPFPVIPVGRVRFAEFFFVLLLFCHRRNRSHHNQLRSRVCYLLKR
jgi:hypothetical protein